MIKKFFTLRNFIKLVSIGTIDYTIRLGIMEIFEHNVFVNMWHHLSFIYFIIMSFNAGFVHLLVDYFGDWINGQKMPLFGESKVSSTFDESKASSNIPYNEW